MIRSALFVALLLGPSQAQAGRDVPPPRSIKQVTSGTWRDMPPVARGWSSDRHVPVVLGADPMTVCEARELMSNDGWADGGDDFAGADQFDDRGFAPEWERMR